MCIPQWKFWCSLSSRILDNSQKFQHILQSLAYKWRVLILLGQILVNLTNGKDIEWFVKYNVYNQLRKVGIFTNTLIKKRKYQWNFFPEKDIDIHKKKKSGDTDSLNIILDNIAYNLFCLKDEDFTMKLMSTFGGFPLPNWQAPEGFWKI